MSSVEDATRIATTWSRDAKWSHKANIDGSGLVATDASKNNGMWACSADVLPSAGKHYFELSFRDCVSTAEYQAVGIWSGEAAPHTDYAQEITKYGNPFWGLRGDGDKDALRIKGKGKGKVGLNESNQAISNSERIGVLVDMDNGELQVFRDGSPIDKGTVPLKGILKNQSRIAVCCSKGSVLLLSPDAPDIEATAGLDPVPVAEASEGAEAVDDSCWAKCWCRLFLLAVTGLFLAHIPAFLFAAFVDEAIGEKETTLGAYAFAWAVCMRAAWRFKNPRVGYVGSSSATSDDEDEPVDTYTTTEDSTVDEYYVVRPVALRTRPGLNAPVIKTLEREEKLALLETLPDPIDGHVRCRVAYFRKRKDKEPVAIAWTTLNTEGRPKTPKCYRWILLGIGTSLGLIWGIFMGSIYVDLFREESNIAVAFGLLAGTTGTYALLFHSRFKKMSRPLEITFLEPSGGDCDVPSGLEMTPLENKGVLRASLLGANPMTTLFGQVIKLAKFVAAVSALIIMLAYASASLYEAGAFCATTFNFLCNDPIEFYRWEIRKMGEKPDGTIGPVYRNCDRATARATREAQLEEPDGCGCNRGTAWKSGWDGFGATGECVMLTGDDIDEATDFLECKSCGQSAKCLQLPQERNNGMYPDYGDPPDEDTCAAFRLLSCEGTWGPWGDCRNSSSYFTDTNPRAFDDVDAFQDYLDSSGTGPQEWEHQCGPGGIRLRKYHHNHSETYGGIGYSGHLQGNSYFRHSQSNRYQVVPCDNSCGPSYLTYNNQCDDGSNPFVGATCPYGTDTYDCENEGYTCIPCDNSCTGNVDLCRSANDGYCDEPQWCEPGTDGADCAGGCPYANDGYCDEPQYCEAGTDGGDCGNSLSYNGVCDEDTGQCAPGTDQYDCGCRRPEVATSSGDETHPMFLKYIELYGDLIFYDTTKPWKGLECEARDEEIGQAACNTYTCPVCAAGTYSASHDPNANDCAPCDEGHVAPFGPVNGLVTTLSECSTCPMGRFAPQLGTDCEVCPEGKHTRGPGEPGGANACQDCATTVDTAGYHACKGGQCDARHVNTPDTLCGACIKGYYMEGLSCLECGTGWFTVLAVLLGLILVVGGLAYVALRFVDLSGDIEAAAGSFDLYMAFSAGAGQFQRLLQVVTINYQFPQSWVDLANRLRTIVDFDFPSLAEPECQIDLSPMGGMVLRTQMVALMIPAIVVVIMIAIIVKKRRDASQAGIGEHRKTEIGSIPRIMFKTAVALHSMFFIVMTKSALAPFDCTDNRLDRNNGAICDLSDPEYQTLRRWGGGMLLVYGAVFSLLHLPNWVETVGLLNKVMVIGTTTFLSSKARAFEALLLLLITATTFAATGFYFRRNCGQGFRVIQMGSAIEILGYLGGTYFVHCGEGNDGQACPDTIFTYALGIMLGVLNIGFVAWSIWLAIAESAARSQDEPSVSKDYTVVAEAIVRADKKPSAPVIGHLEIGTRCNVWEDSATDGLVRLELERDETGALAVTIFSCRQLVPKDLRGNDVEVEIIVNGKSKKTSIKHKSKADVQFVPSDGEIRYRVTASEPIETTLAFGIGSKSAGFLNPKEVVTVYEEKTSSGGHIRVRIDPFTAEQQGTARWASRKIPKSGEDKAGKGRVRTIDQMQPVDPSAVGAKLFFEEVDTIDELRIIVVDIDFNVLGKPDSFDLIGEATLVGPNGAGSLNLTDAERTLGQWTGTKCAWFSLRNDDQPEKKTEPQYFRITSTAWVNDPWFALLRQHEWVEVLGSDGTVCIAPSAETTQPTLKDHRQEIIHNDVEIERDGKIEKRWADFNKETFANPMDSDEQNKNKGKKNKGSDME